ncbi:MAG: sigma-70 family RNA polymerase sigma factor [Deltaproteobacteria bacterium]|nr:sigma-70 family RNA polymerase sigma factor [Deltaproteobacteria bacterium]
MRSLVDEMVGRQSSTDEELLTALKHDQTLALGALYDRYASLVYGLARAILTTVDEAEDLTQEIFLALHNKCDYDPARGTFSAFLITMTRSRAIDKLRSRGSRLKNLTRWKQMTPLETSAPTLLEQMSLTECSQQVHTALAQLPDNQRQVLELAYYKDLSHSEIAAQLDAPLGTVKTWARKGLMTLKDSLHHLLG